MNHALGRFLFIRYRLMPELSVLFLVRILSGLDLVESLICYRPESLWNQRQTLAIRLIHALSQRHATSSARRICLVFQLLMKY